MSRSDEAWNEVGDQFKKLGSTFKRLYQDRDGGDDTQPPSDEEVKDALRTLGESVSQAFATVGDAFNDPEVKEETRQTASLFFDALGATFSSLGEDISRLDEAEETPDSAPMAEPSDTPNDQDQG